MIAPLGPCSCVTHIHLIGEEAGKVFSRTRLFEVFLFALWCQRTMSFLHVGDDDPSVDVLLYSSVVQRRDDVAREKTVCLSLPW